MKNFALFAATFSLPYSAPHKSNADWLPDFLKSEEELFCQECEDILKKRLKSPSSYKRLSCKRPIQNTVSKDEYLTYFPEKTWDELSLFKKKQLENSELQLTEFSIRYEAKNSYGASIAEYANCAVMHEVDSSFMPHIPITSIRVNGMTSVDWSLNRYKRALELSK